MKNLYYLVLLIAVNTFSQISFKTYKFIPLPKEPLSSFVSDINSDGLNDVIIDYYYSANYFSVMKQKTNGELDIIENYTINSDSENISKIDIGDLNNDGRKDIITGNTKGTGIFFQNNDGTIGSFALRTNLPLGTYTIGDLNNDGVNDIFIISYNKIHFAYQNPNSPGTFAVTSQDKTWQGGATQIKDINNDHLNDIIIACSNSKIYTYRQKPEGGFLEPVITNATDSVDDIDVGDINNDGINDLVATKAANNTAQIKLFYPSFEDHIFFSYVPLPAYELASSVKIVDFNNDGKNEIAVTHYAWNSFSVYSSVNNVFSGYQRFELPYTYCNSFYSLSVGDINNDGLADAVMAWYNGINILINNSTPVMNTNETFKIKIYVYPNPASDFLTVKNTKSNSPYTINDMSGKIIKRGNLMNNKIYINSLPNGNYILTVENQQIKFIKK